MAKKKKLSAVTEQKKLAFKVQRSKFLFPILGGTDEGSFIWNAISAIFLEHSNISLHFSRFFFCLVGNFDSLRIGGSKKNHEGILPEKSSGW